MSLKQKLDKVGSLKEAQLLFDKEISRLKRLDVYKESESRLNGRIDKLKNDIDSYLIEHDIEGEVKIYNDYFFTKLFIGIFIWSVLFLGMVFYLNHNNVKSMPNDEVKTTVVITTETTTESNLVWNKYRQSYTSKEVLKQDENWSSVNN